MLLELVRALKEIDLFKPKSLAWTGIVEGPLRTLSGCSPVDRVGLEQLRCVEIDPVKPAESPSQVGRKSHSDPCLNHAPDHQTNLVRLRNCVDREGTKNPRLGKLDVENINASVFHEAERIVWAPAAFVRCNPGIASHLEFAKSPQILMGNRLLEEVQHQF